MACRFSGRSQVARSADFLQVGGFKERKKERKKVYLSSSRNKHGYKDNNRHISDHSHVEGHNFMDSTLRAASLKAMTNRQWWE